MEDRQQQLELMQTEFDHLMQTIGHNSAQLEGNTITLILGTTPSCHCRGGKSFRGIFSED